MERAANAHDLDNGTLSPTSSPVKSVNSQKPKQVAVYSSSFSLKWAALVVLMVALSIGMIPVIKSAGPVFLKLWATARAIRVKRSFINGEARQEYEDKFGPLH
jgi:hypothetical protein